MPVNSTMNFTGKARLRVFFIALIYCSAQPAFSQTIVNGTFDDDASGWECQPEIAPESAYGGSGANNVAKIGAESQLCQTINGFVPGELYYIRFLASGGTSCESVSRSMEVKVNDHVLSATIFRNNDVFELEEEGLVFIATSATHTLTFSTALQETCSMIVDDIRVGPASLLSVDLVDFTASLTDQSVELSWTAVSELENDFYTIRCSEDAQNWKTLAFVQGAGTTFTETTYTVTDMNLPPGVRYYRLSQTDMNGNCKDLKTVSVSVKREDSLAIFPNPVGSKLSVYGTGTDGDVIVYNASGKIVYLVPAPKEQGVPLLLSVAGLPSGIYLVETAAGYCRFVKK